MSNLFLFHGQDTYSSKQKLNLWQREFTKKHGDTDMEIIDGTKLNINSFNTNLEAVPFLSERRLIIVKSFISKNKAEQHEKILDKLEKIPDFCVLVFHENETIDRRTKIYKRIHKHGIIEEFIQLSPDQVAKWLISRCQQTDTKIAYKAANHFGQVCANEMWSLNTEFEKLKTFAGDQEISKELIDEIVTPSISASIFKLTDSIAIKDYKEALKTLPILKESGEELTRVFYMIARHFRIMIQIRDMLEKNETELSMQKKLKQHPFVIKKTRQQAGNFDKAKLKEIYEELLKLDTRFKTGKIKIQKGDFRAYELELEKFIVECCK